MSGLADHVAADEAAHVFAYWSDCLAFLRSLPDDWCHAVITDPPYGLADHRADVVAQAITAWASGDRERVPSGRGFMGREWDAFVPPPAVWDECLRVLKPGGHLAVFAGSRTVDLMGLSIRLAGFELRDGIAAWLYGSGFPKSLDVGKAIDKAAGATREVVGSKLGQPGYSLTNGNGDHRTYGRGLGNTGSGEAECAITAPATDAAREWQGWGTALKPAHEPIILARKPLGGTVAATVLAHGAGAVNVDACRIPSDSLNARVSKGSGLGYHGADQDRGEWTGDQGRWPTNVVLAHAATEVYRLRDDAPDEVAESIRAYYRAREAVRAVRDGVPGDASRAGEAPVLQPGVRECGPSRGTHDDLGVGDVPAVRGDLRDDARVGAQRTSEVLREDLPLDGEPGQPAPGREGAHGRGARADGAEPADARAVVAVEGRELPLEGLPLRPDRDAGVGDDRVGAADGARGREVRDGAPSASGPASGSTADAGRRRAPRQRGEAGQPPGEPRRDTASGAHEGTPGVRAGVPGTADRGRGAEGGERDLEVRAEHLPVEWLPFFDCVGVVDACVGPDEAPGPCVPGCQVAALDEQSGTLSPGNRPAVRNTALGIMNDDGWQPHRQEQPGERMGGGGASRFYPTFRYAAKAPKSERPQVDGRGHPTVKPLGLMRWLVRLLVPTEAQLGDGAAGLVLDPFAGSGTTLEAARAEGVRAVGVEADEHSARLIAARLGVEFREGAGVGEDEGRAEVGDEPLAVPAGDCPADPVDVLLADALAAGSVAELKLLARGAVAGGLWNDDVRAAFTARRLEIEGVAA